MHRTLDRRSFLSTAAAAPFLLDASLAGRALAQQPAATFPGMIVRQQEPSNLEFPFSSLDSFIVPTERFYVRNHFPVPRIEAAAWNLEVAGAVERPVRISHQELLRMPTRTATVTMECAGNNRVNLVPREGGVLWEMHPWSWRSM